MRLLSCSEFTRLRTRSSQGSFDLPKGMMLIARQENDMRGRARPRTAIAPHYSPLLFELDPCSPDRVFFAGVTIGTFGGCHSFSLPGFCTIRSFRLAQRPWLRFHTFSSQAHCGMLPNSG